MTTQTARKATKPAVHATKPALRSNTAPKAEQDAIALLTEDHREVKSLFAEFRKLTKDDDADSAATAALVGKICIELRLHAQLEEEIFYPVVRAAIRDNDLMDEAEVEHAGVKDLIEQLEGMDPADDHYNAKVTVLGENVDHHVKEEQEMMFTKARKAKVDMTELGQRIMQRRKELRSAMR